MQKKFLTTLMCLLMALLLTACGAGTEEEGLLLSASDDTVQKTEEKTGEKQEKTETGEQGEIYVYVCGEVKKPGVYALRSGSRVYEAVDMAGGFTKQAATDSLNLAEGLSDGQMVRIAAVETEEQAAGGETAQGGTSGGTAGSSGGTDTGTASGGTGTGTVSSGGAGTDASGKVNLNTADVDQLQTLSGIGEAKALAIISYREENGGFKKPEDLMNVPGIKEGTYSKIKDQIIV